MNPNYTNLSHQPNTDTDAFQQQHHQLLITEQAQHFVGHNLHHPIPAPGTMMDVKSIGVQPSHPGAVQEGYVPPQQFGQGNGYALTVEVQRSLMIKQKESEEVYRIDEELENGLFAVMRSFYWVCLLNAIAILVFLGLLHDLFLALGCLQIVASAFMINGMKKKSLWKVILALVIGFIGAMIGMTSFGFSLQGGHFAVSAGQEGTIKFWSNLNFVIYNPLICFIFGPKIIRALFIRMNIVARRPDLEDLQS